MCLLSFTLQDFLCAHPNINDTQTGGWQDVSVESKIPIVAITCISLIGTQWFVLSWISKSFVCSWVRFLGVMALMISSASSCHFYQERYPAYLLISCAPVMPSRMPPFLLLTKRCQTAFRWMDHCRCLQSEFLFWMFGKACISLVLTSLLMSLSNVLKKEKPMLHSITWINISCLCMIVLIFFRLLSSSTDE